MVIAGATTGPKAELDLRRVFWNQLSIVGSTMGSDSDMAEMLRMVAGAKLDPMVDTSFPLDRGVEALTRLSDEERFGKIVLDID